MATTTPDVVEFHLNKRNFGEISKDEDTIGRFMADQEFEKIRKPVTADTFATWFLDWQDRNSLSVKKARPSPGTSSSSSTVTPAQAAKEGKAAEKAAKAKKTALLKGLIQSCKSNLKKHNWYASGCHNDVAAEVVMTLDEFNAIFQDVGTVDPTKKPSKTITTKNLSSADCLAVLGAPALEMKVLTKSVARTFQKSYSTGQAKAYIASAALSYSTGTQTLKAKFTIFCRGAEDYVAFGGFGHRFEAGDY